MRQPFQLSEESLAQQKFSKKRNLNVNGFRFFWMRFKLSVSGKMSEVERLSTSLQDQKSKSGLDKVYFAIYFHIDFSCIMKSQYLKHILYCGQYRYSVRVTRKKRAIIFSFKNLPPHSTQLLSQLIQISGVCLLKCCSPQEMQPPLEPLQAI